jgi:hypothetical protein
MTPWTAGPRRFFAPPEGTPLAVVSNVLKGIRRFSLRSTPIAGRKDVTTTIVRIVGVSQAIRLHD